MRLHVKYSFLERASLANRKASTTEFLGPPGHIFILFWLCQWYSTAVSVPSAKRPSSKAKVDVCLQVGDDPAGEGGLWPRAHLISAWNCQTATQLEKYISSIPRKATSDCFMKAVSVHLTFPVCASFWPAPSLLCVCGSWLCGSEECVFIPVSCSFCLPESLFLPGLCL